MQSLKFDIYNFLVTDTLSIKRDLSITDTIFIIIESRFIGHKYNIYDLEIIDIELQYLSAHQRQIPYSRDCKLFFKKKKI